MVIVTQGRKLSDVLKPKQCPNCDEPNKPDSKFCAKCRMVLTYDAYTETIEEKQQKESEVNELKDKYEQDMKTTREEMENKFQRTPTAKSSTLLVNRDSSKLDLEHGIRGQIFLN